MEYGGLSWACWVPDSLPHPPRLAFPWRTAPAPNLILPVPTWTWTWTARMLVKLRHLPNANAALRLTLFLRLAISFYLMRPCHF